MKNKFYQVKIVGTNRKYYIVAENSLQAISCSYNSELRDYEGDTQHKAEAMKLDPEIFDAPTILLEIEEKN